MSPADRLAALLVEEATALRHGDAEAVLFLAKEKEDLLVAIKEDPPPAERLRELLASNRDNGLLARSGLALLNQVLGAETGYGPERQRAPGKFLSESV